MFVLSRSPLARPAIAAALAALVLGCAASDTVAPGSSPEFVLTSADAATNFEVCKYGTAATFDVSVNGGAATTVTLAAGACQTVHSQAGPGTAATPDVVTVTEHSDPSYTLDQIIVTQYSYAFTGDPNPNITTTTLTGTNSASGEVGLEKGASIAFYNSPVSTGGGCTYTQGGYKNTLSRWPAGFSPDDPFFSSGRTWLEMFKTPPKGGNIYIKLAHQYMAAVMNVANGAMASTEVQAAIDGSTAYFNG
ncbi:MAG: hypothetical protein ACREL6_08665, partial [Gemmatimonadales bacterium]